jgi:hypothetical protein
MIDVFRGDGDISWSGAYVVIDVSEEGPVSIFCTRVEAEGFSETSVTSLKTTRCRNAKDCNIKNYHKLFGLVLRVYVVSDSVKCKIVCIKVINRKLKVFLSLFNDVFRKA